MSKVPNIKFVFEGFELDMGKNVLLRPHDCCRNRVNILAYKNLRYIKIGVPILKKYHIVFDYNDNTIGIIKDNSYLFDEIKTNKMSYYYIVICILFLSVIVFSLKAKLNKKKNSHLIDYDPNSNELISN